MGDRSYADKPLLDRLGVKAGMRVAVIGVGDRGFVTDLRGRTGDITLDEPAAETDAIFLGVDDPKDMEQMAGLRTWIKPSGGVWVVFRKGQKEFSENDVLRLGLESGLVDVKVVRFSETHTALKFVIRKAER
ncbi:MAG TPA: hypothetical protein VLS25_10810 [Dehalococcoidia bacterium]|nr:hypothetical protein [Dehalococcoidia bacterium]